MAETTDTLEAPARLDLTASFTTRKLPAVVSSELASIDLALSNPVAFPASLNRAFEACDSNPRLRKKEAFRFSVKDQVTRLSSPLIRPLITLAITSRSPRSSACAGSAIRLPEMSAGKSVARS